MENGPPLWYLTHIFYLIMFVYLIFCVVFLCECLFCKFKMPKVDLKKVKASCKHMYVLVELDCPSNLYAFLFADQWLPNQSTCTLLHTEKKSLICEQQSAVQMGITYMLILWSFSAITNIFYYFIIAFYSILLFNFLNVTKM